MGANGVETANGEREVGSNGVETMNDGSGGHSSCAAGIACIAAAEDEVLLVVEVRVNAIHYITAASQQVLLVLNLHYPHGGLLIIFLVHIANSLFNYNFLTIIYIHACA